MTKKDYVAFAAEFKAFDPYTCPDVLALIKRVASLFQRDNGRFNRHRFLSACGVKEEDM